MNKKKVIISCVLLVVLFLWLDYDYAFQFLRKVTTNLEVKEVTLGTGEYFGGIDIASGYYDVISDDENDFNSSKLRKGSVYQNYYIAEDQRFLVEGPGKLRFVPSIYEKLDCKDDTYQIVDSGYYKIGRCMEAGTYEVMINTPNDSKALERPIILIYEDKSTQLVNPIRGYSFDEKKKTLTCQLNRDEVALIYRGDNSDAKIGSMQFKKIK